MKQSSVNTRFFNFRLFLEALKRLRVIGIGTAILALTVSVLVPVTTWIERNSSISLDVYTVDTQGLCIPVGLVVFLAPLFFFVLFSFLQKRKESDFFHAIPYTRTCVYVSFITAALTFVWAIQLACGVTAGILWSMIPRVTADIGGMIAYVGVSMLAAAMLSAFMMLSLSVSGTSGSCFLLFLLFTGFVRVVCAIFLGCMDSFYLIDTNGMWDNSFLSPLWLLPINVFGYLMGSTAYSDLLFSSANILYSLCVTLGLFAFAGLLYNRRKSEMAGNPAPGVKTQALFRIMFTSLAVLLIPLLTITDGVDAALMLVLIVGVLLVYFLYELITTKRPKNLLKIFPGLGIVAGVCAAFFLVFAGYYSVVINENVTAADVKWVSVESNGFSGGTYQDRLSDTLRTDDEVIVKTVVERLAISQQHEREGIPAEGYDRDYYDRVRVTIRLKGGRTIHRYICMGETARKTLLDRYSSLPEISEIMYRLPTDSEIQTGGMDLMTGGSHMEYAHFGDPVALRELMATFRAEFDALTDEQKALVMAPALEGYYGYDRFEDYDADIYLKEEYGAALQNGISFHLRGKVGSQRFNNEYIVIKEMKETRRILIYLFGKEMISSSFYEVANEGFGDSPEAVLAAFKEDASDPEFTETFSYLKGTVRLTGLTVGGEAIDNTFLLSDEDYVRFAELLQNAQAITQSTKESEFILTEDSYFLYLYNDRDGKYSNISLTLRGVFTFTPEELEELKEILHIEK